MIGVRRFLLPLVALIGTLLALSVGAQNPLGLIGGATPTIGFAKNQCAVSNGSTVIATPCTIILGSSGAAAGVTGTTSETQLASITVPAGAMGKNGAVGITTLWSYTNSANGKTVRVRFGGPSGVAYQTLVATTTATLQTQTIIINNNSTGAQKAFTGLTLPYATSTSALTTSSVDTTAATTIYISGQLASSGETITLESYTVELIPGTPTP